TSPPAGDSQQITVVLTWGASPADLDIHMSGPASGGSRFHLYWNNRDAAPYAAISGDDDNGGGPETITIKKNPATGAWVPGEYRIWAHNYSGTPGFGDWSARVTVTRGSQQLGVYNVSSASGNASQPLWRAVNLTIDANGNVTLSPVQKFANGDSNSVLRLQDGPGDFVEWPVGGKP